MKGYIPMSFMPLLGAYANMFPEGYDPQRGIIAEIGCTAIAVDGGASVDGSAMAGMNVDCAQCDNRLTYIESRDYRNHTHSKRPVFANLGAYPRLITHGRSSIYEPENNSGFAEFTPVGSIPQPAMKTFGYWESTLPLMNEAGLTIGESSCGTRLIGIDGAILDMTELVRIAAERCSTALCAVETIGSLSEQYGFMAMKNEITPGSEASGLPAYDDAGEAMLFADTTGEAWVFHITGGFPGVANSTWAAQRVPKGHVVVLANTFIIKELPSEPNDEFKFNRNIRDTARAAKIWSGSDSDPFNFSKIFGMDTVTFQRKPDELPIPLYTALRTWRVFDLIAPSLGLRVDVDNMAYPFSVRPDKKVSHRDLMRIFGDFYGDSEFDMREGIMAGPFGTPYRLEGGNAKSFSQNPRGISIPRTSYSVIGQSKLSGPSVAWFAIDQPMTSVYIPLLSSVHSVSGLDSAYQVGSLWEFDRKSAFWAFDFVSNWMNLNWRNMSAEEVFPLQQKLQNWIDHDMDNQNLTPEWQKNVQSSVVSQWWNLADRLIVKYNDGYYTKVGKAVAEPIIGRSYGYPDWFQMMIGQTADVHPVWVEGWSGHVKPLPQFRDVNSVPADLYGNGYTHPVPSKFDYVEKHWVMTPAAVVREENGSIFWSIAITAILSVFIGFMAGRVLTGKRPNSSIQQPLLA
jgi:dipeptidase